MTIVKLSYSSRHHLKKVADHQSEQNSKVKDSVTRKVVRDVFGLRSLIFLANEIELRINTTHKKGEK
ncbi:hypothetical protein Bbad01_37670 [Bacillus badius]|nr:hypothetical protein Bbad01_37670 [Bacillus badius]